MTRDDLIRIISQETGMQRGHVVGILDIAFGALQRALVDGGRAPLPGIGALHTSTRAARIGRNPLTGEQIEIPEKRIVKLRMAKEFSAELNGPRKASDREWAIPPVRMVGGDRFSP